MRTEPAKHTTASCPQLAARRRPTAHPIVKPQGKYRKILVRGFWKLSQTFGGSEVEFPDLDAGAESAGGAVDLNDRKINPTPPNSKTNITKVLKSVVGLN